MKDEQPTLKEVFDSPLALRDFLVTAQVFDPSETVEPEIVELYNNESLRFTPIDPQVERFLRNQPGNPKKILMAFAKLGVLKMFYDKRINDVQIVMSPEVAAIIESLMGT